MMTQKQVRKTKEGISFGLKVLLGILFISPLIIGFLFSIQYEDELTSSPLRLFTANPTLINYIEVFQKVPIYLRWLSDTASAEKRLGSQGMEPV